MFRILCKILIFSLQLIVDGIISLIFAENYADFLSFWFNFQGAKDLAKPPTLTDIVHAAIEEKAKTERSLVSEENQDEKQREEEEEESDNEVDKRGTKRKLDPKELAEEDQEEDSDKAEGKGSKEMEKIKKAKNVGNLFCILLPQLLLS